MIKFRQYITEIKARSPEQISKIAHRAVRMKKFKHKDSEYPNDFLKIPGYNSKKANKAFDEITNHVGLDLSNLPTKPKTFHISELHPMQPNLGKEGLSRTNNTRKTPLIITHKNVNYIMDRHHQIARDYLGGQEEFEVDHYDLDAARKKKN